MGTSPKKDIKQPILSSKERTRLEQIATLRKTLDKLTTLRDSCPDSLVQGALIDRTYCDEAKPMYEQLNKFISQIVIQQVKLTKQINPLDPNELLKESMLKELLHNEYDGTTLSSHDENPWFLFINKVNDIFEYVDPLTADMPTHNKDQSKAMPKALNVTERHDANRYKVA